ncbi:MAG TPA: LacI family DNA-binding transcriptional regulator [Candidatus Dormibacteraeota bacterium]|nr:LacI family DNA-binding transcriptional regulator [Candidatus Dormibacteraeota bacterium]
MPRRPTQTDVARLAGVSQTLVSLVLNDNRPIAVPAATRKRILDAVEELSYVRNTSGRQLRLQRAFRVAAVVPDITNLFYPSVVQGVQNVADRNGYEVLVLITDRILEKELKVVRLGLEGSIDGVVAAFFQVASDRLRRLVEWGVGVVRVEAHRRHDEEVGLDSVYIDNAGASRDLVIHLIERGHRRIGVITSPQGPGPSRLRGYREAHRLHGLAVARGMVVAGDFSSESGHAAVAGLLALPEPPTAIFAANDMMAIGASTALLERGLRIPGDVAVAGFDDIPVAGIIRPPLTTVAQDGVRMGERAAELLFERLTAEAPLPGRSEQIPHRLIVREST